MQVLYNDALVTPEALVEAVEDAGFDAMLLSCKKNTPTSVPEVWFMGSASHTKLALPVFAEPFAFMISTCLNFSSV